MNYKGRGGRKRERESGGIEGKERGGIEGKVEVGGSEGGKCHVKTEPFKAPQRTTRG